MWFTSWLRKWKRSAPRAGAHRFPRQRSTFRPRLEALEDRWLPSTLIVNTAADANPPANNTLSLREAINVVNTQSEAGLSPAQQALISGTLGSNDTIVFDHGLAGQTIQLLSGQLVITKSLTIQGPAAPLAPVTISGGGWRLFEIDGVGTNVALSNLNLTGGGGLAGGVAGAGALDGQGGAIWNDGILTLNACNLDYNSCEGRYPGSLEGQGGAIYNAGTLTVNNSELFNNTAGAAEPPVSLLTGNSPGDGGAIYNAGRLTVNNSEMDSNYAYYNNLGGGGGLGGGIFNASNASATITGSTIRSNDAGNDGSGIYNAGTMTLIKTTVYNNYGAHGEDDLYNLGSVKLQGSTIGVHGNK